MEPFLSTDYNDINVIIDVFLIVETFSKTHF